MATDNKKIYNCDFCGKKRDEVAKLIVGTDSAICNECIDLCTNILKEEKVEKLTKTTGIETARNATATANAATTN